MFDDNIIGAILTTLPDSWQSHYVHIGANWTLSVVRNQAGALQAGLATTPRAEQIAAQTGFHLGVNDVTISNRSTLTQYIQSPNPVAVVVGFATLNALLKPDETLIEDIDAADWLVEHGRDRRVAVIGRFPFIDDELAPVAAQLWVFELKPRAGEYGADDLASIIPQADILAITGSTLVNHTLAGILALASPTAKVMLLGPTTPLTPVLFDFGVDLLAGVLIDDVEAVMAAVAQGATFRSMAGVRRVTIRKKSGHHLD